jgi:hypothetical protein
MLTQAGLIEALLLEAFSKPVIKLNEIALPRLPLSV